MTEIPEEWVEEAAKAVWEHENGAWPPWQELPPGVQGAAMDRARAALAAVLPLVEKRERERAFRIVTKGYQGLCTEHRLLLVERGTQIMGTMEDGNG